MVSPSQPQSLAVMWPTLTADAARHAVLAVSALAGATLIGVPLGVLAGVRGGWRSPILGATAIGRTLPSIALLTLLLPLLGVGTAPALVALVVLALPPIVFNVDTGIRSAPASELDAATGLGMDARQRFRAAVVPHALPVALSGLRTAAVEVIGSATLATFIGGGGLGDDIVRGLQTGDTHLLVAASALVAAMALLAELLLSGVARAVSA
jgi:osmoprotectant transport system permease protein